MYCKELQWRVIMFEIIKEFIVCVVLKTWKEFSRDAGRGMGVMFFCMLAFFCIVFGIYLGSRCARVYCITPEGKKKLLGDIYIKETKGGYRTTIPSRLLERSDSIYYYMEIPAEFTDSHYMEQLLLDTPRGRKRIPIKKRVRFKIGLGEQLAPIRFS